MALRFTLEISDQVATVSLYEEVAHDSDDRVRADAARNFVVTMGLDDP